MAHKSYSEEISDPRSGLQEHKFIRKKILNKCSACDKRTQWGEEVLECHDCQRIIHTHCKDSFSVPCTSNTSTRPRKSGTIDDFARKMEPFVPFLVIKCLIDVESRGMGDETLYIKDGNITKAKEFARDYILNGILPNFSQVDTHTVATTLKIFLTWLSEPLIIDEVLDDLVSAYKMPIKLIKDEKLCEAMWKMPRSNRNTLAYIVRHLRKVNDEAPRKIIRNVAWVFGPIVVGGSPQHLTPPLFIAKREVQAAIFKSLLEMDRCDEFIRSHRSESLWVGPRPSQSRNFLDEPDRPNLQLGEEVLEFRDCQKMNPFDSQSYHPGPSSAKRTRVVKSGNIADYTSSEKPVSSLVAECLSEIELRGMRKKFLYRQDGDLAAAKSIVKSYLATKIEPDLSEFDVHTVASILKTFLRWLSEPLITDELRDDFINASLIQNKSQKDRYLCDAIKNLPPANRDNLSYIIRHLRDVVTATSQSLIPNLARVFGPILVGGSSQYSTPSLFIPQPEDQFEVVESLLEMDDCATLIDLDFY